MKIGFNVLNEAYEFEGEEFDLYEDERGEWNVEVDGEEVYSGTVAPCVVHVEDEEEA